MELIAKVEALCIRDLVKSAPLTDKQFIECSLEGIVGDVHFGFTKPADGRDVGIKRGTMIRNWRQWSAVSTEELAEIARLMNIDSVDPRLLSANITFSGIPSFTQLPKGTTFAFENGVILVTEAENAPCTGPGKEIQALHSQKKPHEFVKAAMHKRGLVGVVHKGGIISRGECARVDIPMLRNTAQPLTST